MRDVARQAVAAAFAVFAWCGVGSATAADFVAPGVQPPAQYYGEQEYYEEPPLQPGYALRPPALVYPYPPPPVYRYGYVPPVAVVPPPYFRPRYYGPRYGYVARHGYGPYGRHYRYHGRYR